MHITKMHFAFLNAVKNGDKSPLARTVVHVAQVHHAAMVQEVTKRALREAEQRERAETALTAFEM